MSFGAGQLDRSFVQRLRELGWIEGRTIAIEYRWAEGRNGRFAEVAVESSSSTSKQQVGPKVSPTYPARSGCL